jgi:hypothetical protein
VVRMGYTTRERPSARSSQASLAPERADKPEMQDMRDISGVPAMPKVRAGVETYIVPDGTCFLYDPASDASYALDQVGALVWDFCGGNTPVATIIAEVADLLPAGEDVAGRVTNLLAEFASERLLVATEEWPGAREPEAGTRNG